IEPRLHDEARAEQAQPPITTRRRRIASRVDDVNQRDRRRWLDLLEREVNRVRGEQCATAAGGCQVGERLADRPPDLLEAALGEQPEDMAGLDAVDHEPRVAAVRAAPAPGRD